MCRHICLVIKIPQILGKCITCPVSGGSPDLCLMESSQDIDGRKCPPAGMGGHQPVFRKELRVYHSIDLGLSLDLIIEFPSDVLEKLLDISVICRDVSLDRCIVAIFLQDLVGGIRIHAHLVNVHPALRPGLDLHDGEDVPVKAGSVNPHHVGESLPQGTGEDKVIPHPLHVPDVLFPSVNGVQIKVVYVANLIRCECDLLMVVLGQLHEVIGWRDRAVVP